MELFTPGWAHATCQAQGSEDRPYYVTEDGGRLTCLRSTMAPFTLHVQGKKEAEI